MNSGKQLLVELVAGVIPQCGLRISFKSNLWQELSRSER